MIFCKEVSSPAAAQVLNYTNVLGVLNYPKFVDPLEIPESPSFFFLNGIQFRTTGCCRAPLIELDLTQLLVY